jgi:hypothetical protein
MLKEALARRRGKGLEIDIAVGAPKQSSTDALAPEKETPEHGEKIMKTENTEASNLSKLSELVRDNPEASALVAKMISDQSGEMAEESSMHTDTEEENESEDDKDEVGKEIMGNLSDYEKADLMSREKPRSLGERAKMMAMKKV